MRDSHLNSDFILSFLSFPPISSWFSMSKYVKIGEKEMLVAYRRYELKYYDNKARLKPTKNRHLTV